MNTFRIAFVCITLLFASCKKETTFPSLYDGKSTVIEDLAGDTGASIGSAVDGKEKRPFYIFLFRLKDKRQIWVRNASDSAQWLKTLDWDLSFTGPYNSEIYVNNSGYEYNPGYGGPAQSKIVMVDLPYAQVNEAPEDAVFEGSKITKIGWAATENSAGWFTYSLNTHIMQAIKSRTYIIQLPNKKYAKLELLNAYQGNPPVVTDLNWPAPYFTFRYYVQEDGKNLRTN